MTDRKKCGECLYFSIAKSGFSCGTCEYPVPAWLKIRVAGGNFVSGVEAQDCYFYKTKEEFAAAEVGKMKGEK